MNNEHSLRKIIKVIKLRIYMKLYPYPTIKTENLKGLLIASRVLGFLSYILFFIAICIGLFGVFSNLGAPKDLGNGIVMSAPNAGLPVMIMSIWGAVSAVSAVFILAFSGLCAAVVSCEYKYTKSV
ncbi:hypothetical protein PSH54_01680 [Pseudoalteromonas sp. Angola-30]|uniref:hypothetical protein n=1 Tax=Pseudoalteromonas sp. Angola-30 TaxID=3025341 RepID=UPI0023581E10|nr:hypothetical protein [Pseudoalteromonas sp. Angola-30]MDC9524215.1 hypothetical protein [Pseudoalteromonas sp. Angola-30]